MIWLLIHGITKKSYGEMDGFNLMVKYVKVNIPVPLKL